MVIHRDRPSGPNDASLPIRPGSIADLDAIVAIENQAFEPQRRSTRRSLRHALTSGFQRVLVLEADGRPAGYAIVWPFRRSWRLYNIAADPGARRRGVGSRLLDAALDAARAAGAHRLVLESRTDPDLMGWYEKRGFKTTATLPDYYAVGEDAVRMQLLL